MHATSKDGQIILKSNYPIMATSNVLVISSVVFVDMEIKIKKHFVQ